MCSPISHARAARKVGPVSALRLLALLLLAPCPVTRAQTNLAPVVPATNANPGALGEQIVPSGYWMRAASNTYGTRATWLEALAARDWELAAAAYYNLLHIPLAGTNGPVIEASLDQLATVGDEFTVEWLGFLSHGPASDRWRAQLLSTRTRIQQRLAKTPASAPEKRVRERLLRAAVANATCNPMELTLPGFVQQWAAPHAADARFRAELQKLAAEPLPARNSFCRGARGSMVRRATMLLESAQPAAQ